MPENDPDRLIRGRYGLRPEEPLPFAPPAEVPPGLAAILDRRVTRRYAPDPVPEPLLQTLLAAAQSAPSKSDLQQYAIIVIQDAGKIARIADWIGGMDWIRQAPVFLLFCGDIRRGRRACEIHGRAHANDNVDTFVNATADAALALGFTVMAAEAAGLGTCPISYVRNHVEKIGPLCGLPPGVYPVAGLTLGFPMGERNWLSPRLPQHVVVHRERYDDSGLAAALPAYDAARPPAKPRYPEIHGAKPEGCGWSENAARQLSVPERFGLRTWLKLQGLSLD
ncbi:nitroreductase family protein [Paracraurococcus lichenis]|uniref:Nitroreductase family protein n=1 Tax=Paracraurococcus lichenis TaxID=3064888 RepID=A0ABT9DWF5_9PROT|nr:nitroreductase family protein [Paracraurococcus sp. LOR1-02]MDO9708229.1 nitroreductase family protein [Paracraurococcus sp. LOR1-02]